jgi:hypothetical protein
MSGGYCRAFLPFGPVLLASVLMWALPPARPSAGKSQKRI